MSEGSDWKYFKSSVGLYRVKEGEIEGLHFKTLKWKPFDYANFDPPVGSYGWSMNFDYLTPERAKNYAKAEYGLDKLPE